jgi:hypothetical protein
LELSSSSDHRKIHTPSTTIKKLFSFKEKLPKQDILVHIPSINHRNTLSSALHSTKRFPGNDSLNKNVDFPFELEFASYHEFSMWKNEFQNWLSYLEEHKEAKSAIFDYTSDAPKERPINHAHLNFFLRTKTLPTKEKHLKKSIKEFDSILQDTLSKVNLPSDTIVYRKISEELLKIYSKGKDLSHLTKGELLVDDGYMSTSLSRKKVEKICIHGHIILKISAPKGTQAGYVDAITFTKGEEEVLFNKGQRLEITKIRDTKNINGFSFIECNLLLI